MTPDGPDSEAEYVQRLQGRLGKFTKRTRRRVADLTGWQEVGETDDPQEVIKAVLDNWPGNLEHVLPGHGVNFPLIDKVRRIRNDICHGNGTFTRNGRVCRDAMWTIGKVEAGIRRAGAARGPQKERETDLAQAPTGRGAWRRHLAAGIFVFLAGVLVGALAAGMALDSR